ncbi:sugar ABC transporter substrate-binding protein [Cryobacterium sp. 5B3]|uniref:ABC transporter substrate-binding protein n=2 Tax=unclassified Cryobacterium TaxID=2649013 RepID=UPI002AB4CA10|nr:sugar ABC transporter substrate-binding protein [Cryobacterium sp. 5B3]MDY7542248.1 sugar ABC transporter substrate-binding protein [Cryobacterium sp. 5B3]MEB0275666.1 sugar ABC transporter substrate-binding protein [Cryobacterium sp. 5B3]
MNSKGAMFRRAVVPLVVAGMAVTLITGCSTSSSVTATADPNEKVTLEFSQWWEPELPAGALRTLMDEFQTENPNITVKLLSAPYAATKDQTVAGAASGVMSDVVGLDGAWVSDFAKQGALADLSQLMKDAGYDESQLASQVKIKDSTFMIPVLNFVYPMFTNDDLLAKAGVTAPPTNRTEFTAAAEAVTKTGDAKGWVLPLSLQAPNGIQNDVMSWAWASGGSMLKNGAPDLTNTAVKSATSYVKDLWDKGVIAPGSLTMTEQDKVEEFTNGRVGMMIDSLSHVTSIREKNPNLKFSISAIPAEDGFTGKRGIPYASWGIGVSDTGKHKAEAWKLVQFLMSEKTNSTLSTLAHAFPGNTTSTPDFTGTDPLFKTAFDIYKSGTPVNEFVGLPVAEQLMRDFDEQFQGALTGTQSVDDMLTKAQGAWTAKF